MSRNGVYFAAIVSKVAVRVLLGIILQRNACLNDFLLLPCLLLGPNEIAMCFVIIKLFEIGCTDVRTCTVHDCTNNTNMYCFEEKR